MTRRKSRRNRIKFNRQWRLVRWLDSKVDRGLMVCDLHIENRTEWTPFSAASIPIFTWTYRQPAHYARNTEA